MDELPGRVAQRAVAAVDDAQRPHERPAVERDLGQRAGRDLALERRLGQQAHAGVDLDRPLDRFDVVELQRDVHRDVVEREHAVDLVANRQARSETRRTTRPQAP